MARIRDEWDKLIEVFAEIRRPQEASEPPRILYTYPKDYSNREVLNTVPFFAYPCSFKCDVITHFSFVLTNINSKWTFGYCRHTPDSETSLVILSDLPWHSTFYKILDHCAELSSNRSTSSLERFIEALYITELPQPGLHLTVTYTVEDMKLREFKAPCPDHMKLPCIPEDRNISEYYNAISATNMIAIFASMLNERRIVMVSERLNRLSACVQAANMLIYPMHWQHIFIPLLPHTLIDYLTAPMPFLIGVPAQTFHTKVRMAELGEIVILDVDNNQLTTPFDDVSTIPSDVIGQLRKTFKQSNLIGDALSRAFLRALVTLIGGYREALRLIPGERITFDRDAFVSNVRGTSRQLFLENMLQLQIFQQFIESRLDIFNRGERFVDQFEIELNENETRKLQYREWTAVMRKEGRGLLMKLGKTVINKGRQTGDKIGLMLARRTQESSDQNHNNHHQRRNWPQSEPSSPTLPPTIKKSISGNFIPTPTSRTVTYVRNPASTSNNSANNQKRINGFSSTSSLSRTNTNSQNRSRNLTVPNGNGIAPSASSESSDIDDNDFGHSSQPIDLNIKEELESIFQKKIIANGNNGQSQAQLAAKSSPMAAAPIPPPRNFTPGNRTTTSSTARSTRSTPTTKCLIEFEDDNDITMSTGSMTGGNYHHRAKDNNGTGDLHALFDPLLTVENQQSQPQPQPRTSIPGAGIHHHIKVANSNFFLGATTNTMANVNNSQAMPPLPHPAGSTSARQRYRPQAWQKFD